MTEIKATLLFVDDDAAFRQAAARALQRRGYEVISAVSAEQVLKNQLGQDCDAAVLDLRMPGMDGLELLQRLKQQRDDLPVIMLTGHGSINTAIEAIQQGAFHYLTKPCDIPELDVYLRKALDQRRMQCENQYLRHAEQERAHGIVGSSPAIQHLLGLIERLKDSEAAVMVTGESGTGKELVARALHYQGARHDKPFIAVNCATLKPELLENELFGHVSGAFTGATRRKEGLLSVANGGTLFVDEIVDMDPNVQASLLRVIESGEYRPLGSTKERTTDVRVIAAANRNLEDEVKSGRFREDLFYRLNVLVITTPPLRTHKEDIPELVEHFLRQPALPAGRPGGRTNDIRFTPEAIAALQQYHWPGNVRELMNVCERAVLLSSDKLIRADEINALLHMARPYELDRHTPPGEGMEPSRLDENEPAAPKSMDEVEYEHIRSTLNYTRGNVSQAAEVLGIDRRTLQRKMAKFGLRDGQESSP